MPKYEKSCYKYSCVRMSDKDQLTFEVNFIVFRYKILRIVTEAQYSSSTRRMHAELLMALTFQASMSILYIFSVASYAILSLQVDSGFIINQRKTSP